MFWRVAVTSKQILAASRHTRIKIIRTMKPLRSLQKCLFLFVSTNAFYENISLAFKPIPLQLSNKLRKREKAKKVSFKA